MQKQSEVTKTCMQSEVIAFALLKHTEVTDRLDNFINFGHNSFTNPSMNSFTNPSFFFFLDKTFVLFWGAYHAVSLFRSPWKGTWSLSQQRISKRFFCAHLSLYQALSLSLSQLCVLKVSFFLFRRAIGAVEKIFEVINIKDCRGCQ